MSECLPCASRRGCDGEQSRFCYHEAHGVVGKSHEPMTRVISTMKKETQIPQDRC